MLGAPGMYPYRMQSILPSYPAGLAGGGLLVLRLSVSFSFLHLASHAGQPAWLVFAASPLALGLVLGIGTRFLAIVSACASIVAALYGTALPIAGLHGLDAVALALAGPGAFSADARLFGPRTVVLPGRGGRAD
jgi:hypothetical protein